MKVAAARLRLLFGAVFAVLLCLTACGGDVRPEDIALEYLERINGGEYEEAYALLSIDSQAEYSLEDYAAIHEKIFNGLGVLNIEHDDGVLDEAEDRESGLPLYRGLLHVGLRRPGLLLLHGTDRPERLPVR